jgi:hypothetical protein
MANLVDNLPDYPPNLSSLLLPTAALAPTLPRTLPMRETTSIVPQARSSRWSARITAACLLLVPAGLSLAADDRPQIVSDVAQKLVTLSDGHGQLALRLNYQAGCVLDRITVRGREVTGSGGVTTGIRMGDEWFTTRTMSGAKVDVGTNSVTVTGLQFGPAGREVHETWQFTTLPDRIVWQITRRYSADDILADMAFPQWSFSHLSTWTGALLDNGGVIWNKYLDQPNATYGAHFGTVTFWNAAANDCLRITPKIPAGHFGAGRCSRLDQDATTFCYAISDAPVQPAHGQSRFLGDRQDLWQPVSVHPSEVTVEFELQALDYRQTYDRGTFVGVDGTSVRELLNTVARYGVIDSHLVGGNGWRSGFICLHEPFFAQIAATVDAADYTANFSAALDFARDHAINADGRVKSRWAYDAGDAMPGSYDQFGFYEAQWGYLMDSQPDYVMNVVEQFHLTGDRAWLARHQDSCERALAFLTRREVAGTGLVAMMTDSRLQARGSDWIDIIWASYENALINAQLYAALNLWAEAEDTLGNAPKAQEYRAFAARLKASFNRTTADGGFWDSTNQWYAYWRDRDSSVHGNNLVTPVNFAAIAYGLCDNPARKKAILDRIESEMQKEGLFYWPLSFFPYAPDEGAGSNFPFPKYENGDLFLSWGELGVRAYAGYNSKLALKYVNQVLDRYRRDGLSFQRYLRASQRGEGDDILAGNCLPIVGLYRDLYGIQPQPNRLYVEPHLPADLDGTRLRYTLRDQLYEVSLRTNATSIIAGHCTVRDPHPFGLNATATEIQYFPGASPDWTLSVTPPAGTQVTINIETWPAPPDQPRQWTESTSRAGTSIPHIIQGLKPNTNYRLEVNGHASQTSQADSTGQISFLYQGASGGTEHLKLIPEI